MSRKTSNLVRFPGRAAVAANTRTALAETLDFADADYEGRIWRRALRSRSRSTQNNYRSSLRQLDRWLAGRPLSDESLADYCEHRFRRGLAPGSIRAMVNAAKFRSKALDQPDPAGKATTQVREYITRNGSSRGRGHARGLSYEQVERMIQGAEKGGSPWGLRDAALIAALFYCGLRRAEAVALDVDDVMATEPPDPAGKPEAVVFIRRSKTDQEGRGAAVPCPSQCLDRIQAWIEYAGISHGPLLRPVQNGFDGTGTVIGRRMNRETASVAISKRGKRAGIKGVTSHSLRRSFAQDLSRAGMETHQIQEAGRWKTPGMVYLYTRNERASRSAVLDHFRRRRSDGK